MAGTAVAGELTSKVRFAVAELRHEPAIRALLRANPTPGAVSLSFEREPDYFTGAEIGAARDETILAFEHDRLVCMGRCTERPCWINGRVQRAGYLGELRLDRSVHGRFDILRGGYAFFEQRQRERPVDFYFTSIAADNHRARRLLERGVRGLPHYRFLTEFVTLVLPVPRPAAAAAAPFQAATGADAPIGGMAKLLNEHASRHPLAADWTEERLGRLARHGLARDQLHVLYARDRLVACAALWDQRSFRQTVIRDYAPWIGMTRPLLNPIYRMLCRVELPAVGATLPQAFVSPLATVDDNDDRLLRALIRTVAEAATRRGIRLLTLGFPASDRRLAALRRHFHGREYRTRLYQVSWSEGREGNCLAEPQQCMPEVALL